MYKATDYNAKIYLPIKPFNLLTIYPFNALTIYPTFAFLMILVTGASGFLGSHLVHMRSAQGATVRALYHSHAPSSADAVLPGVSWQKADLLDIFDVEEAMKGITQVYHCAAIVSFQPHEHKKMLHFNPESTANIVNQAIEQGIEKMVYVSSIAALGRGDEKKNKITEEEQWGESGYNSAYAISKYLAETEVWRGIGEGLNAVIVSPGVILGEGDFNDGSAALMKIAAKEFPFYTDGITAWTDVKDVASIMVTLMHSDIEGERYIVSQGNYAYKEIFTRMALALGKRPPHIHAGPFITNMAWRLGRLQAWMGKKPVITRETARNAQHRSLYSNTKLLQQLPSFSYTPIDETIARMAKAFKNKDQ